MPALASPQLCRAHQALDADLGGALARLAAAPGLDAIGVRA